METEGHYRTFKMGDIQGIGHKDERPVHEVTFDAFAIGRYPVTVGEFRQFVEAKGYRTGAEREDGAYVWDGNNWDKKSDANWRKPYFPQDDRHPVVCVSWNDVVAYCEWLSERNRSPAPNYTCRSELAREFHGEWPSPHLGRRSNNSRASSLLQGGCFSIEHVLARVGRNSASVLRRMQPRV